MTRRLTTITPLSPRSDSKSARPRPAPSALSPRTVNTLLSLRARWSIEILAFMAGGGVRFVQLLHRFRMSRDGLRATLDELLEAELIQRNPGYGHALRSEYILTEAGVPVSLACSRIVARLGRAGREPLHRRRWALQALAAMNRAMWFNDIKAELPGVTSRALTIVLRRLVAEGLVIRTTVPTSPPRVQYRFTAAGRRIARLLEKT